MEGVFSLPAAARTDFIHSLVQSYGGSYICLWSHDAMSPNRLSFLDGFYNVSNINQPSSSLGTLAPQLFSQFQSLTFDVNDDRVPGLAFRNQCPYLELQQLELLRLASTELQAQFYQEARIKTAVFMGCNKGEIELGFLNMSQADIQTALRSLFPEDFSRQTQQIEQNNPPTSSSSSLRSLSTGSPEYSSLLFNIPGTSSHPHFPETLGGALPPINTSTSHHHQQQQQAIQLQALAQTTPIQLPTTPNIEHDAVMRAILNVISPVPSQPQNLPYMVHREASAFMRYRHDNTSQMVTNLRRQSLMKRSFAFFRSLNFMRMRERNQATRPSSTQLHHMISERRRREKLNENFQALRALLPPGTKKDKASILITAKETLSSLLAEVDKQAKRNQESTSVFSAKESTTAKTIASLSPTERLSVQVSNVPESSSSQEPIVDLHVNLRGQVSQADVSIRLLEFLKQVQHVSLISMSANTHVAEGNAINQLTFRLRIIQGSEWDEVAFEEAVRRVVADLAQCQVDQ